MSNANTGSTKKRPRDGDRGSGTSATPFSPSPNWQGAREGYFFGTGDQGTGYYLDTNKRQSDNKNGSSSNPSPAKKKAARKGVVIAEDRNETHVVPSARAESEQQSAQALLQQAEASAQGTKLVELTARGIEHAGIALNKALDKNQMHRAKYADNPEQYMDSEVTLYEHIRALQAVAASPETLYEPLVAAEIPATLLQLVAQHENTDIITAVWAVWSEWIDPSLLRDDEAAATASPVKAVADLARQLLTNGTDTLVESIGRLASNETDKDGRQEEEEKEDDVGQGVGDILTVVEHLLEMDTMLPLVSTDIKLTVNNQTVVEQLCQPKLGLLAWLLEQVDPPNNEKNDQLSPWKDRSLEILALMAPREELYQESCCRDWSKISSYKSVWASNGKSAQTVDGIEILLQLVAGFRKRQPSNETELDALENSCIVLDAALTYSAANLGAFIKGQGIELVIRCLKERVHSGGVALKWLDFAGSEQIHKEACLHMVGASALKYLLPLLMDRNLPKPAILDGSTKKETKQRKKEWSTNIEQTTVRILYALTRHLPDNDSQDSKARLIAKFADDKAKCDRVVELILRYDQKARQAEYDFYRSDVEDSLGGDDNAVQLAGLEAKLLGGGDLFHRLGAAAAFLCVNSKACHAAILAKLRQQKSGIGLISAALNEFVSVLGDAKQKQTLQSYMQKLGSTNSR